MRCKILLLMCIVILVPVFAVWADSLNVELIGRESFGPANDVYVAGNYAYLCAGGTLVILDITDTPHPVEVGRINTPGIAWGIYIDKGYAYIADGDAGLRVIDVSAPDSPHEIGSYDTSGDSRGIHIVNNLVYIADGPGGMRIIDVSDPMNPHEVGVYETASEAQSVYWLGTSLTSIGWISVSSEELGGSQWWMYLNQTTRSTSVPSGMM